MIILPAVIDVELDETEVIEIALDEEEPVSMELEPKYVTPLIPENYCRFEWDGTRLRFS